MLQAASAFVEPEVVDGQSAGLRLTLESMGGDVVVESTSGRRIIQLKTLFKGTWSPADVVRDVFPDLIGQLISNIQAMSHTNS